MYVILVFCACVLVGVDASNECSEPDPRRGRFFCAVIARDSLCQNGTVSNETCQNCTQLESYCGPLQLTNETEFCAEMDEQLIQFCPVFRAVNCTGDPASRTDDQQRICDYCLVIEREECSAPPPSVCSEFEPELACSAVERLEDSYTCTELFPPEEDDAGPCLLCEYYELFCGRPLGELNTTRLCGDDGIVVYCHIISMREECTDMADNLDPEEALECTYCSFVSDANCTLPPPTGDDEICNETELESFCATALGEGLCPGTTFAEETCEICLIFELLCGPPQGDITDLCNSTEAEEECSEAVSICSMEDVPEDNITLCDACRLRGQRCEAKCFEFELQLFCTLLETPEFQDGECIELFPEEAEACAFCEDLQETCGRPPRVNTTILCDNDVILDCFIANKGKCLEDELDQDTAFNCSLCTVVDEQCVIPPPTGDNEICSEIELEAFCATALGEGLCPGTTFADETCDTCYFIQFFCGPPEGDIKDFCDDAEAIESCVEVEPVCTKEEIPRENITLCDTCDLREERCSGRSMWVISLPVILAALMLGWMVQD